MKSYRKAVAIMAVLAVGSTIADISQARPARHYHAHARYERRCHSGNGAIGTVAGGVGGAVIGNSVGGGTLGTVAGGVGGALLGRHLDKANTRQRSGC